MALDKILIGKGMVDLHLPVCYFFSLVTCQDEDGAKQFVFAVTAIHILNELLGQICGNRSLAQEFEDLTPKFTAIAEDRRRLSEPKKRAMVNELRERLRHTNVENF